MVIGIRPKTKLVKEWSFQFAKYCNKCKKTLALRITYEEQLEGSSWKKVKIAPTVLLQLFVYAYCISDI